MNEDRGLRIENSEEGNTILHLQLKARPLLRIRYGAILAANR